MRTSRLAADHDRVLRVVEGEPVDRVEVVLAVAVGVEAVHHHHELLRGRARIGRVDDERAVEALVDVLLQRRRVAVVELHPVRPRRELVGVGLAGLDDLEDAVHVRRVDAVEVDRVRVRAAVREVDAQEVVLGGADHRPGHGAVVRPRLEEDALRDLDLACRPRSACTRARGRAGAAARPAESAARSRSFGPPGAGVWSPIIAAWPSAARVMRGARAPPAVARSASFASGPAGGERRDCAHELPPREFFRHG